MIGGRAEALHDLLRGVVVEHEMDVEFGGRVLVHEDEELLELGGAMAGAEGVQDLAGPGRAVQGGEQGGGAVADVVVGDACGAAGQHRQDRMRA